MSVVAMTSLQGAVVEFHDDTLERVEGGWDFD